MRLLGRCWLAAALLLGALGCAVPSASAGTYDVVSCQTPSGTPTSVSGWEPWSQLLYDKASGSCDRGGRGLAATFSAARGGVAGGLASGWTFRAPNGTKITDFRVTGGAVTRPAADRAGAYATAGIADAGRAENAGLVCATATACHHAARATRIETPSGRAVSIFAGCAGSGDGICARGTAVRARARVQSARITLDDATPPRGSVSGAAVETNAVRGKTSLRIAASDVGAGVWQAQIQIGSRIVKSRTTLATNDGRCRKLPGSTAFPAPVPCALKLTRTLAFDTSDIPDGSQMLSVTIWDAANNPTVVAFRPVLVDNRRHVQPDGTIFMPAPDGATLDPLGPSGGTGQLAPPINAGDPELLPLLSAMDTLATMRLPYCYGGGHGITPALPSAGSYCWLGDPAQRVTSSGAAGFDCSSSVSWVLQQAGVDVATSTSSGFMNFGDPGPGRLLTIWTNPSHVFIELEVAGRIYYWGTAAANPQHGPGWHAPRATTGFVARHIPGL